jgi:8-oxo-dGTP diphosphatase
MLVRAAGVVLWRPSRGATGKDAIEVGLVHRPKYGDWSLPKGKLDPGEHLLACAVREVVEETGHAVTLGRPLPTVRYPISGGTKEVHYWVARADDDAPPWLGTAEIDRVEFVGATRARSRLTHAHDAALVEQAAASLGSPPLGTSPLVLLRHGKAVGRSGWRGPDPERPLEAKGTAQADRLAVLLGCFGVERVVSSDAVRCVDTVRPYATTRRVHVELEPRVSEEGFEAAEAGAADVMKTLLADAAPTVVCSHRPVLPALVDAVAAGAEKPIRKQLAAIVDDTLAAGGFVVVHRRRTADGGVGPVVAVERHELA